MRYIREHTGKFIELRKDDKTGWEWVARMNNQDIVSILAITKEKKVILIEQFRVPVDSKVIESPAGLVDEGESFLTSAKRELLEETGYTSETWSELYTDAPNSAGLTNETTNKFLATDCIKEGEGGGLASENENITTHLVDVDDVVTFTQGKHKEGMLIDPKIFAGLYFYLLAK